MIKITPCFSLEQISLPFSKGIDLMRHLEENFWCKACFIEITETILPNKYPATLSPSEKEKN